MMRTTLIIAILMLPFFIGCAQDNPFGTVYLEGTVTLDEVPVEGVFVTLNPRGGDMAAGGMTDARGKFTVQTAGAPIGSGAKPGEYDVVFRKTQMEGSELSMAEFSARYGGGMPPTIHLIPERYGNSQTSGIEPITVDTNRRNNVFHFPLTSE